MATAVAAAKHIFVSESRFNQLARKGVFERAKKRGDYDLDIVREIAFKQLRDELRARGDQAAGLTEERTRLAKANAAEREDRIDAGELVDIKAVVSVVSTERSIVREKLLGMGGKLQGTIGVENASVVDVEAREILAELADPNALARRAARAPAGIGDVHDKAVAIRKEKDGDEADA